jgi:serine/threonine-protein kinase
MTMDQHKVSADNSDRVADAEVVFDDELLFDDAPRRPAAMRRDERNDQLMVREGDVLAGKYRVERIPGRSGLGVVVQVRHLELGQEVTLKFLVPDACAYPEFVQRFVREARAAVKIQGEHVARVTDVGRLEWGAPYMVREFLRGPDLAEVLKVRGPLPVTEAVDYIIQACEGVAEGHALGVVHRNLRPQSLVVTRRSDGTPLVKVFDFAAAESLHVNPFTERAVSLVGTSAIMASLPYLAPEQIRDPHDVDFRADVYALGAILHELLTGVPVYSADSAPALLAMVAADAAPPVRSLRPDAPGEIDHIVLRCLSKNRAIRYGSVAELALALRAFASVDSASAIERIVRLSKRTARPTELADTRYSYLPPPSPLTTFGPPAAAPHPSTPPAYAPPASAAPSAYPPAPAYAPAPSYAPSAYAAVVPAPSIHAAPTPMRSAPPLPSSAPPARGRNGTLLLQPEPLGRSSAPALASMPDDDVTTINPYQAYGIARPEPARRTPQPPPLRSTSLPPPLRQSAAPPPGYSPTSSAPESQRQNSALRPPRSSIAGVSRSWATTEEPPAPVLTRKRLIGIGVVAACATLGGVLALRVGAPSAPPAAAAAPVEVQAPAAPAAALQPPAQPFAAAPLPSVAAPVSTLMVLQPVAMPSAVAVPGAPAVAVAATPSVLAAPAAVLPPAAAPVAVQTPVAAAPVAPRPAPARPAAPRARKADTETKESEASKASEKVARAPSGGGDLFADPR